MQDILLWIIIGLITAIVIFIIVIKIFFKESKINIYILSVIGVVLAGIGLFFSKYFDKIAVSPINIKSVTPSELEKTAKIEGDKTKEEKENELAKKTPDEIIDNELPADAGNNVRTRINDGKRKIDSLFNVRRVGKSTDTDKDNIRRNS